MNKKRDKAKNVIEEKINKETFKYDEIHRIT